MKTTLTKLVVFIFISALFFQSCTKDGAMGPTGPAGAKGDAGAAGPAGTNGSVIYSGTSDPAATVGNTGDFYLNLSSGNLFGPKTASGWGTAVSLKGSAGTSGSQIYSGTTVPDNGTGATGDFYLDKSDFMLYGPKTASDWGTPIGLQGPEGNANVVVDTFTLKSTDWLWNSVYIYSTGAGSYTEYFTRYYNRASSSITQGILDNGEVSVYFTPNANNLNQWAPLAYQFNSSFGYEYNYVYETSPGNVRLHFFFVQTSTTATLPALSTYNINTAKFKIVAISGAIATSLKLSGKKISNYAEMSRITGMWQSEKR